MTKISVTEGIAVVSFNSIPAAESSKITSHILGKVADSNIRIDMISLTPSADGKVSLGYTVSDDDIALMLTSVRGTTVTPPMVQYGNVKLIIKTAEMANESGFASKVFTALGEINPLLITTAVDEISILVCGSDAIDAEQILNKIFD